jgi:hypothetical protein
VFVVNIGGDADDAVRCGANPRDEFQHGIGPIDMPINSILMRKHALCQRLTDDDDGIFIFTLAVEVIEITTREDGNAEGGEESGRYDTPLRARIFFAPGMNMTVGGELQADAGGGIAPGNNQAESGLFHAG